MAQTDWKCIAYCLMSHRLDLAMIAGEQPLESWAKRVNPPFAHWLNRQRRRLGPIFAHRPISLEASADEALEVVAHVHNRPVRARIVTSAGDVSWSSHRAYLGRVAAPSWLHVARGLELVGFAGLPNEFDQAVKLRVDRKPTYVDRPVVKPFEVDRESRTTCDEILSLVTAAFGLQREALQHRYVRGPQSDAKRVAIHVARECGVPLATMAASLQISRQRASLVASTPLNPEHRARMREIAEALDAFATGEKQAG
jgi:hypothetical protein